MPYVAYSDLSALVPPTFLTSALDDIGDGSQVQATFTQIAQQMSDEIDGALSLRGVPVPLSPDPVTGLYPTLIVTWARVMVAETLYSRRGMTDEKNPFQGRAASARALLKQIALNKAPLPPELDLQAPAVTSITQPMQSMPGNNWPGCTPDPCCPVPMNV